MEEIMEKLQLSAAKMDEAEKDFKDKDDDVNAQNRRVLLLEEDSRISVEKLATTVMKLAHMSKDADNIVKSCRHWESKTMNNEVEIEEIDINLREARRMASENEMKYDNLARSLAMMEDELKRADGRVKNAEARVVVIEDELAAIGENQKALEVSEEEARGEVGPDQADPDQTQAVRLQVRVRRDEHQQAAPQDRRAGGRDHQGEVEDQRGLWPA